MTYQPPPGQWHPPHQPEPDSSSRALKLSGAALIWVIIGVITFCVGGPILCCFGGLAGGLVGTPSVSSSP